MCVFKVPRSTGSPTIRSSVCPAGLVKTQMWAPPSVSDSGGLGRGLRIRVSGGGDAACLGGTP